MGLYIGGDIMKLFIIAIIIVLSVILLTKTTDNFKSVKELGLPDNIKLNYTLNTKGLNLLTGTAFK